jgi:tetratricopeptide (TPR) repeat protein
MSGTLVQPSIELAHGLRHNRLRVLLGRFMAEPLALKYRAFISYSHADTRWAKWLHRGLESFRIDKDLAGRQTPTGTVPKALSPVFRDRDDFTAGHSLTEQTLAALDASSSLVVICSPAAAKSRYVNEEIRLFKSRHPDRPVVPLIVGGKPDDSALECFPPALKYKLDAQGQIGKEPEELLAADVREEGDGKSLALAKVIAGVLGVTSDDVFRRAERERRRKARVRNGIIAVLAVLVVAVSGSASYAWQQLKTNEEFLDATLERATELTNTAVRQAESYGVPRRTTLTLLEQAESLFDDMARLGRPTPRLRYEKAWMLIAFARNYELLGDTAKWGERAEEARQILAALSEEEPGNTDYLSTLGLAQDELSRRLVAQGDVAGALNGYRNSVVITTALLKAEPDNATWQRDLAVSEDRIGDVLRAQGDLKGALAAYRQSFAMRKRLAEAAPDEFVAQYDLSMSNERIGDMLMAQGDYQGALGAYRNKLDIVSKLSAAEPENVNWRSDVSVAYVKIGNALLGLGDAKGALENFVKDLEIAQSLAEADPSNTSLSRDLSISYNKVGDILFAQGKLDAAMTPFQGALAIRKSLAEKDPANLTWQRDLASSYQRVGDVRRAQGDLTQALAAYQNCFDVMQRLTASDPGNADWQRDLAIGHIKFAAVAVAQGKTNAALAQLKQAREIIVKLKGQSPEAAWLDNDLADIDGHIADLSGSAGDAGRRSQGHDPRR